METRDRVERSIESKGEAETSDQWTRASRDPSSRVSPQLFWQSAGPAYSCSYSVSLARFRVGHPSCRTCDKASCILNHSASETNVFFLSLSLARWSSLHNIRINIGGRSLRFIRKCRHRSTSINEKKNASMWKLSITPPYSNTPTFFSFTIIFSRHRKALA